MKVVLVSWSKGHRPKILGAEIDCAAGSKVIRCLVEARWVARLVIHVASWNPNHQTFPRAREQNSIFVSDEFLSDGLLDLLPTGTNQTSKVPLVAASSKVTTPTDADPIQFESLTLKFCQSDFEHVRGANVVWRSQKPIFERDTTAESR